MTGQTAFRAALLDAAEPVPDGLSDGRGRPAGKRFSVYRNNVAVSLTEALRTGFPAVAALLGADNFDRVAGAFLRAHPPADPRMMFYGAAMPEFLAGLEPLAKMPWLPDVARLELALRRSYHAADAAPIAPEALAALDEAALQQAVLTLAPAVQVLSTPYPVLQIRAFALNDGAPKPTGGAEDIILTRPGFDPETTALPPGSAALIAALTSGDTLGKAADNAPHADLPTVLAALLNGHAITAISVKETPPCPA